MLSPCEPTSSEKLGKNMASRVIIRFSFDLAGDLVSWTQSDPISNLCEKSSGQTKIHDGKKWDL